jgi:mono/diheme cytochrome c family protein
MVAVIRVTNQRVKKHRNFEITQTCVPNHSPRQDHPHTIAMVSQHRNYMRSGGRIMAQWSRTLLISFVLIFLGGLLSILHAAQKGSENKGRYYFRQTCKECHTKGAAGGEITPLNKTMAQWRAYFAKGTHNHGKEPLAKYLPADQLLDASTFLTQHAADSPQPETCGK